MELQWIIQNSKYTSQKDKKNLKSNFCTSPTKMAELHL